MRQHYQPEPAPASTGANILAAILAAVILAAPMAAYFWSMKP